MFLEIFSFINNYYCSDCLIPLVTLIRRVFNCVLYLDRYETLLSCFKKIFFFNMIFSLFAWKLTRKCINVHFNSLVLIWKVLKCVLWLERFATQLNRGSEIIFDITKKFFSFIFSFNSFYLIFFTKFFFLFFFLNIYYTIMPS